MANNAQFDLRNNNDDGLTSMGNTAPQSNQRVTVNIHRQDTRTGLQKGSRNSASTQRSNRSLRQNTSISSESHSEVTQQKKSLHYGRHHLRHPVAIAMIVVAVVAICAILGSVIPTQVRANNDNHAKNSDSSPSPLPPADAPSSASNTTPDTTMLTTASKTSNNLDAILGGLSPSATASKPAQTSSNQSQPPTAEITPKPSILPPMAKCEKDSDCGTSPYLCHTRKDTYTEQSTTRTSIFCCAPHVSGCPGYNCSKSSFNDCLDPYPCDPNGSTCLYMTSIG